MRGYIRRWANVEDDPVIRQRWQDEPELHYTRVYVESLKPIPKPWGPLIGDAIHNYRSALDHLGYALVKAGTASADLRDERNAKRVYFPYFTGNLSGYLTSSFVAERLPGVDSRYIAALAPFQPGLRPGERRWQLKALQRLDDLEKHREPLLTPHLLMWTNLIASHPMPFDVEVIPGWKHLKPGTELVHLVWKFGKPPKAAKVLDITVDCDNPSMDVKYTPTCSIVFGDLKPRREVKQVLGESSKVVRQILEAIERI
ncbi:MAG TPA: hypothetical protein VMU49_03245 [Candidatus Acidoferrales bacterium]|nr:hypothetical protein [Candidatus Acidoferrales bacterium]